MKRLSGTTRILLIIMLILSAVTGLAGIAYLRTSAKKVEVPDFIGKEKKDVETWALENKIASSQLVYDYIFDDNSKEDTVLQQSLPAKTMMKKKDILTISVSSGPDPDFAMALPDFSGKEQKEVEAWFQDNHFTNVAYAFMPKKLRKIYF